MLKDGQLSHGFLMAQDESCNGCFRTGFMVVLYKIPITVKLLIAPKDSRIVLSILTAFIELKLVGLVVD